MEEIMTIDKAWKLVGEACYCYSNKQARLALMIVKGDNTKKTNLITEVIKIIDKFDSI